MVTTLAIDTPNTGQLNLSAGVWTQLKTTNTPCTKIAIAARAASANANNVYFIGWPIGSAPVGLDIGERVLPPTATGISYLLYSDARILWFYAITSGDRVNFSIE